MANLDAQSKLLSLNDFGEFHTGDQSGTKIDWLEPDSSGSTFAPEGDTRSSSKRRTSNTRSSGPSSSIIER